MNRGEAACRLLPDAQAEKAEAWQSALRPTGPAYGRDPRDARRRSRCGSLATLPRVAFRPPPLTPAQPAERLRSMASRSRHRSAVVAGLGLSRRVAERRRTTLPMGRVSSASAQPALTCPVSRCLGQPARSVQARYGFRCTESSCPPAAGRRTAPRPLSPKGKRRGRDACCVPAQMLSRLGRSGSPSPCAQAPRTPASPSLSRAA